MNHIFTWKFGPAVSISENSGNDKLINPPCREHDFKLLFIMTEREPPVLLYYLYTHTLKTFLLCVFSDRSCCDVIFQNFNVYIQHLQSILESINIFANDE